MDWMALGFVLAGLALLWVGGEVVVRGSVRLARRLNVSKLLIGIVVVAFGTSSPELVVAILSTLEGAPGIAVGNVIGSNIANIMLVLAMGAVIVPILAKRSVVFRDGVVVLAATLFLIYLALMEGEVSRLAGIVLVGALIIYVIVCYVQESAKAKPAIGSLEEVEQAGDGTLLVSLLITVFGLAMLVGGSHLLVEGAVTLATDWGVSEAIIGVSVVAIGTSLPELAAVLVAALRKHADMAVGGIVGSNIFNILVVLGITSLIMPIPIDPTFLNLDIWVMLGAVLIMVPFLLLDLRLNRIEGLILLALYALYIYVIYAGGLRAAFGLA